ncbi:MAG TPA: glycosyltransferase family 39 protein, partial [Anaerolineales bacterium]|nr:glycosyltransferase family 39 protein [Anaerolineales bacterium]
MAILLPLGAFVLRVIRLDYKPLWWDEGRNVFVANLDWQSAANVAVRSGDVNPPVYRMLLSAWMSTVSPSPLTIRLLSVFFGVLTVAVIYRFAVEIFNRRVGTITGVLSACAPAFI